MSDFAEYVVEVLATFGHVTTRKMFGGYGVYHNGLMFGLIADDELFLKVDDSSVEYFHTKGLGPFEYQKKNKLVKLSYYRAPEEIFDDPEMAELWARRAYQAAVSANATKRKRKKS